MEYNLSFVIKKINPMSGFIIMKQMLDKIGIREKLSKLESLHKKGSSGGYGPSNIILGFIVSV